MRRGVDRGPSCPGDRSTLSPLESCTTEDVVSAQRSHVRSEESKRSRPSGSSSSASSQTQSKGLHSSQSRSHGNSKARAAQGLSLSYEAYTHFAVFSCLFLRGSGEKKPTSEVVKWYLNEKVQFVPTTIPPALQTQFYTTLVNNLVRDKCVTHSKNDNGAPFVEWNPTFPLWAWKAPALEYEASFSTIAT